MNIATDTSAQLPGFQSSRSAADTGRGFVWRSMTWIRQAADRRHLREMDPRLARDIGVARGWDRPPEGFVVDPRPLWGIGLTPQPAADVLRLGTARRL